MPASGHFFLCLSNHCTATGMQISSPQPGLVDKRQRSSIVPADGPIERENRRRRRRTSAGDQPNQFPVRPIGSVASASRARPATLKTVHSVKVAPADFGCHSPNSSPATMFRSQPVSIKSARKFDEAKVSSLD